MSFAMHRYPEGRDGLAAFCDTCGEQITEHGYVLWNGENVEDWIVVHQARCDPGRGSGYDYSMPLEVELFYLINSTKSDMVAARRSVDLFERIG